jgi:hypothetical protein
MQKCKHGGYKRGDACGVLDTAKRHEVNRESEGWNAFCVGRELVRNVLRSAGLRREGRGALFAALFGLGCAGEIWYLDPDLVSGHPVASARRDRAVSARGESACGRVLRTQVAPGETLSDLARFYGVSVARLAEENGIRDPNRIAADSWLRIPPGARVGCPPSAAIARALPTPARKMESPAAAEPSPAFRPSDPVERSPASKQFPDWDPFPAPPSAAKPVDASKPSPAVKASPAVKPSPAAESSNAAAQRMLERAQSSYDAADFEAALELAKSSLHLLENEAEEPQAAQLRARAAWIEGLSHTALGHREPAVDSFRTALALDPSLADQQTMSPKVRFLVESARVAVAAPP